MRAPLYLSLFASAAGLLLASPAPATAKDINWTQIRTVSRKGPFTTDFKGKVYLRVPTGYRLVTDDKLSEYHDLMGDAPTPEEVAVLLPEEGGWVAIISFPKLDPLKDQDRKQLNTESLMKWNESILEDGRPKRTTLGLPVLKVTGWTHKPTYEEVGRKLIMGMRISDEQDRSNGKKDELYHKTLIYGPDEVFVCLQTVTSFGNWDKPLEETKKLVNEFSFGQPSDESEDDPLYYAKIGGAGLIGVLVVVFGAKLLGGRRPEPAGPARAAARRFGSPR